MVNSPEPPPRLVPTPGTPEFSWNRLPQEGDEAWAAFVVYRDMGMVRSIAKVAHKLDKDGRTLERWSSAHAWRKRVLDFENEQDRMRLSAHEQNVHEMAQRHSKLAMTLFVKIAERLKTLDVNELEPKDLINWARTCVQMERQSRGADLLLKKRKT